MKKIIKKQKEKKFNFFYFTSHSFSISHPANNFIGISFTKIVSGWM
jgi:hypothetical protein